MPKRGVDRKDSIATKRRVIFILGDQLDHDHPLLNDIDPVNDVVCMAEVQQEADHVWCHKKRLAFFFSAMRHFADALKSRGLKVWYHQLNANPKEDRVYSLSEALVLADKTFSPTQIAMLEPGDHRVYQELLSVRTKLGAPLEFHADTHYLLSRDDFGQWAHGRKTFILEHFYRFMRKRHKVLLTEEEQPEGGEWNFDSDNRKSFGKQGPQNVAQAPNFEPDEITTQVLKMVDTRFAKHPGTIDDFDLPVTREDALKALKRFITERLSRFGDYQDAMWEGANELNHSRLSPPLNVHLLNPREVISAAEQAYHSGKAPLNSVEGFIRQILGWREFIRGIYWNFMPEYEKLNFFSAHRELPQFYWDGQTEMRCVADAMRLVTTKAYAHHIQRLMVLGLLAQLIGVDPYQFNQWHVAMYADAIDWVSLPNTLGMSQFGDGGIVGTKPYCASGAYIDRMSNYCKNCRYKPKEAITDNACPFTTLYWHFLLRNYEKLKDNQRLAFQLKALENKDADFREAVNQRAEKLFKQWKV